MARSSFGTIVGFVLAAVFSLTLSSQAQAQSSVRVQATFVKAQYIVFCHGFGCHFETNVRVKGKLASELEEIMEHGEKSPAHEREAIKQAVAYFERHAARFAGTEDDIAGNYEMEGNRSQLDCVDEARNTTRLLILLQREGLLKHHTVARIEGRGFVLDTRYPHNTAVIREKETGIRWSVDSWMRHNGDVPEVMTLARWKRDGFS
ncbi:MAG: hypothetical protein AAGD23_03575 [Pseudomonadota bacterium]